MQVAEVRDILLVLIIAAEHYSLHHDADEYVRLLTFCKRVCVFFAGASDTGTDPFLDIRTACTLRVKAFRVAAAKGAESASAAEHLGFVVGPEAAAAPATSGRSYR